MNLEGRLLGNRYEILEKIGNGGMATVYKATDLVLKRYVAVKVLRDEFTTDEELNLFKTRETGLRIMANDALQKANIELNFGVER